VGVPRRWIENYGVPLALYTGWKAVYVKSRRSSSCCAARRPMTQFAADVRAAENPNHRGQFDRRRKDE